MTDEQIQDLEVPLIEDSTEGDDELGYPVRYTIASYGSDMPIDGLVDRLKREDIFVPEFQRNFVWTIAQASRFIESLLLGITRSWNFPFQRTGDEQVNGRRWTAEAADLAILLQGSFR